MENKYNSSCGCHQPSANQRMADCCMPGCNTGSCPVASAPSREWNVSISSKVDELPLGMAYVPMQHYDQMFPLCRGLKEGTIFPELCLPFCGKRRKCSC